MFWFGGVGRVRVYIPMCSRRDSGLEKNKKNPMFPSSNVSIQHGTPGTSAFRPITDIIEGPRKGPKLAEAVEELFSVVRDATMIQGWIDLRNKNSFPPDCRFFCCVAGANSRVLQQPQPTVEVQVIDGYFTNPAVYRIAMPVVGAVHSIR